ncbi:MAG: dihydrolipoyl dehydrogenase [Omnitrophica WOR_2 bacterium GWA2_47_8]|nr:MAG: dihydrolipoyl dehydrogenase [Omnitrophica WOR_2 bacterium GWA2_47_8]
MNNHSQLIVIGGGPGGYAAAFLAADLGLKVTLVDMEKNPGGVCLFRGCIPSKALLHIARILCESREAKELGIEFASPKIDINKVRAWKDSVVTRLTGGVGQMAKLRKVAFIQGQAKFIDSNSVKIKKADGSEMTLAFDHAILATGSFPISLPFAPKSARVLDSTTALELADVPQRLLVVGGGYIGMELGTVYRELGSKVSVVEMTPGLLPGCDRDLAAVLEKRVTPLFESIKLNTKVVKMDDTGKGIAVTFEQDGKQTKEDYDKVLVSIGRKPNSQNLGLENTKVKLNERGFAVVNAQRQTTDPKIYAIGDIAGEPMLAHKASHEGRTAAEAIAGHKVAFEPNAIPAVVFTDPEIAWCGLTETEAKNKGREVEVVKFPWGASGRAVTLNRIDGLTKLIIDPATQRVLGMGIVGVGAGELIAEGVLAVEMGAVAADIKLSIHPHPTLTETIMETAETFFGQSTHFYRPKK